MKRSALLLFTALFVFVSFGVASADTVPQSLKDAYEEKYKAAPASGNWVLFAPEFGSSYTSYLLITNFNDREVSVACQFTNLAGEQKVGFYAIQNFATEVVRIKDAAGSGIFNAWCSAGDIIGSTVIIVDEITGAIKTVPMTFFDLSAE